MTSTTTKSTKGATQTGKPPASLALRLAIAWAVVGVPLAYGVLKTVEKASALFA